MSKNDNDIRLKKIFEQRWINYPQSDIAINHIKQLLEFNKKDRPQNLLLLSETNNGKTIIGKKFEKSKPPRYIPDNVVGEKLIMDVIMVQCPYIPDEKLLVYSVLDKLNVAYRASKHKSELLRMMIDALKRLEVKILILDEIQHLLARQSKQIDMLNLLKYISTEIGLILVGIGTKEAFYVINSDQQIANRFNRHVLPKWKYDKAFLGLLKTFNNMLDLKNETNLVEAKFSRRVFELGEGLLGEYLTIIQLCWKHAITSGEETINRETLEKISFIQPSKRRDDKLIYE